MCLGGHLAYRCALDARVVAAVCYFATDIHSHSLGRGMKDDSLERAGDIRAELIMVSWNGYSLMGALEILIWRPADLWQKGQSCSSRRKRPYKKDTSREGVVLQLLRSRIRAT